MEHGGGAEGSEGAGIENIARNIGTFFKKSVILSAERQRPERRLLARTRPHSSSEGPPVSPSFAKILGHQSKTLAQTLVVAAECSMNGSYWVYIVASDSGTLYTGFTNNLERRIAEHKQGDIEGFSARYHCTRLVWMEEHSEVLAAIAREKQIKGWLRSKKLALIESENPHWQDLAEHWGWEMSPPPREFT